MGKHIAGLTAVTVMHAAAAVSRPEISEVRGAAALGEVRTTQVEVRPNLSGFPLDRLEIPASRSAGQQSKKQAKKKTLPLLYTSVLFDLIRWIGSD